MKLFAFLAGILMPFVVLAQGTSTGGSDLKFLFPARILSMADATIADTANATSSFVNPASLASGKGPEIMFSQMQWIQDIQTQLISTSVPLLDGTIAFAISSTSIAGIEIRDVPGPPIGTFNAHSTVFQLGYGMIAIKDVNIGATVKYLYDKLYIDEASGYAIDIGGIYTTPVRGLALGATLTNIGRINKFRSDYSNLPSSLTVGVNYGYAVDQFKFVGAVMGSHKTVPGLNAIHLGAEVMYSDLIAARIGYQTSYDIRGISAGLGIRYAILQLDYAYVPFSEAFGDANIITIGIHL